MYLLKKPATSILQSLRRITLMYFLIWALAHLSLLHSRHKRRLTSTLNNCKTKQVKKPSTEVSFKFMRKHPHKCMHVPMSCADKFLSVLNYPQLTKGVLQKPSEVLSIYKCVFLKNKSTGQLEIRPSSVAFTGSVFGKKTKVTLSVAKTEYVLQGSSFHAVQPTAYEGWLAAKRLIFSYVTQWEKERETE